MTYLITIDPGASTGVAIGWFDDHVPYAIESVYQIEGGCPGFVHWWKANRNIPLSAIIVVEKFILSSGNCFVADLSGVQVEGFLMSVSDEIVWQYRSQKATVSDQTLKDAGLWVSSFEVDCEDSRDINDALLHALIYLRSINHRPSLLKLYGGMDNEVQG